MGDCPQCGDPVPEHWKWCAGCGAEVESGEPEELAEPEHRSEIEDAPEPEHRSEIEDAPEPEHRSEIEGAPEPEHRSEIEDAPEPESLDFDDLESTDEWVPGSTVELASLSDAPQEAIPVAPMSTIEIAPVDEGPVMAVPVESPPPRPAPRVPVAPPVRPQRKKVAAVPTVVPLDEGDGETEIVIGAACEYASVPAEDPPVMGVLLEIEAIGEPIVDPAAGAVAHVILALDLSASMNQPDKYPVMKDAVRRMFRDLKGSGAAEVLVTVVIYSRGSEVILKGVSAWEVDEDDLFATIEGHPLCFGDYTDSPGALGKAGRIAYDQRRSDRNLPVRVYLLTDGKPQDTEGFAKTTEMLGKVTTDLHALAFGTDADMVELSTRFAGKRGGTVKSVRKETIGSAFERVAEVAQKVVATRCLVEFELAPGVTGGEAFRYRPARVRYPEPAFQDASTFATDLGTIEAGRAYTLLFEVRSQETESEVTPIGRFTVRIPGVGGPITKTLNLAIPRTPPDTEAGRLNTDVRTARDILGTLTDEDPETALRALRLRREIYVQERRDPGLLGVLDRAIELLETHGDLEGLSPWEQATLMSHTCS